MWGGGGMAATAEWLPSRWGVHHLPLLFQALGADGDGGLEFLGEGGDTILFNQPTVVCQGKLVATAALLAGGEVAVALPEGGDQGVTAGVGSSVLLQTLAAAQDSLQITGQMLQVCPGGEAHKAGIDEPGKLLQHVVAGRAGGELVELLATGGGGGEDSAEKLLPLVVGGGKLVATGVETGGEEFRRANFGLAVEQRMGHYSAGEVVGQLRRGVAELLQHQAGFKRAGGELGEGTGCASEAQQHEAEQSAAMGGTGAGGGLQELDGYAVAFIDQCGVAEELPADPSALDGRREGAAAPGGEALQRLVVEAAGGSAAGRPGLA